MDEGAPGLERRRRAACLAIIPAYTLLHLALFAPALLEGRILAPGDGLVQNLPAFAAPVTPWTTRMGCGHPLLADPQAMALYPPRLLLRLLGLPFNAFVVSAYVVASAGAHLLARRITGSLLGAATAGIVYGTSGFLVAHLGHTNMIHAAAWVPFILLGLELPGAAGIALTAIATAMLALAGHPQVLAQLLLAAVAYALVVPGRDGRIRRLASLALGLGLACVQLLPAWELALWSTRHVIAYATFSSIHLPLSRIPNLLLPHLGGLPPTELDGFAGIGTWLLAAAGLVLAPRGRRATFLAILGLLSLLLALGDATPLSWLLFHVPPFHLFRAPARHLLGLTLAGALLAAIGAAELERADPRRAGRALTLAAGLLSGTMVLALALVALRGWPEGSRPAVVAMPAALLLASVAVASLLPRGSRVACVALPALLVLDLWQVAAFAEWRHASPPASSAAAPAYLDAYRADLEKTGQRLIVASPASDVEHGPVASLPLLWDVPSAGAYNPLLLRRLATLVGIDPGGAFPAQALSEESVALDLLGVKYLFLPRRDVALLDPFARSRRDSVPRAGILFTSGDLGVKLRAGGVPAARAAVDVPGLRATHVAAIVSLPGCDARCEGLPVLRITIVTTTAERVALEIPGSADPVPAHLVERELRGRRRVARVEVEAPGPWPGPIGVHMVTLRDAPTGRSSPLPNLLDEAPRWLPHEELDGTTVRRNARVLPRAWLAPRTLVLPRNVIAGAICTGRLPGGVRFDAREIALVEEGLAREGPARQGRSRVEIREEGDTTLALEVEAEEPGLLVTSDVAYPGWTARVDGREVPIRRTDYAFRGVDVPAGHHAVAFTMRLRMLRYGALGSLASLLATLLLARREAARHAAARELPDARAAQHPVR